MHAATPTRLLLTLALAAGLATAQRLPGPPAPEPGATPLRDLTRPMIAAAEAASARGDPEAWRHLERALPYDPHDPDLLAALIRAAGPDRDAALLWASALISARVDGKGRVALDREQRQLLGGLPTDALLKLAAARADAVRELAELVKSGTRRGQAVVGRCFVDRWAAELAWELMRRSPGLIRSAARSFDPALAPYVGDHRLVLGAIKPIMDRALSEGRPDLAIRSARILLGLASQAAFKDLKGPKAPELAHVRIAARAGLGRAREQLARVEASRALGIEELEAMGPEEQEAFTRDHLDFSRPGIARSVTGRYRVETSCGHATLLGTASTVELHHERLARWLGVDPFVGQPGIVRVVPRSSGLENEGTPHWWAGGFQSGPVTTVKFACGNIAGLGRGLTHELTHRFDGALFPGIPAWLSEGRAVWTAAAYAEPDDRDFVTDHVSFGTVEQAYIKGYGREGNLKRLVEGRLDDFRDNYTAGYALYVYLRSWEEDGKAVYAPRLARFMERCKTPRGRSMRSFVSHFADGKKGRPAGMEEFAARFHDFLRGFHWQSRASWTERYTHKLPRRHHHPWIYDGPTWHEDRSRSEPRFGQDQAAAAGWLLLEQGKRAEAAAAFSWSLHVDEWRAPVAEALGALLDELSRPEAAWALRRRMQLRAGSADAAVPLVPELRRRLAKTLALLATWRELIESLRTRGFDAAAAALAADHDRIAAMLAAPPLESSLDAERRAQLRHPFDEPPHHLGLLGWEEDDLSGYEERRVRGLWYTTPEHHLHVGRRKPRTGTGTTDRRAVQRHAFVRSREWLAPGSYVLETRIFATTSFVAGAIIVGDGRRDRNLRLTFSGGDFLYAVGAKEESQPLKAINASLRGLRVREGGLRGASPRRWIDFPTPATSFAVRIAVDGPVAHAWINEEFVGSYHTPDGLPLEGHIGFASSQGAFRVQLPTVQRRDRSARSGADPTWPRGLDLKYPGTTTATELINRATRGIPLHPEGTLVLWIPHFHSELRPKELLPGDDLVFTALSATEAAIRVLRRSRTATPLYLAAPGGMGPEALAKLRHDLEAEDLAFAGLLTHAWRSPLTLTPARGRAPRPTCSLLFVDPQGVLRVASRFEAGDRDLKGDLTHWCRVFHMRAPLPRDPTAPRPK